VSEDFFQINGADNTIYIFRWSAVDWVSRNVAADVVIVHFHGQAYNFSELTGLDIWNRWLTIASKPFN